MTITKEALERQKASLPIEWNWQLKKKPRMVEASFPLDCYFAPACGKGFGQT
jgi:hypothetical protein